MSWLGIVKNVYDVTSHDSGSFAKIKKISGGQETSSVRRKSQLDGAWRARGLAKLSAQRAPFLPPETRPLRANRSCLSFDRAFLVSLTSSARE